MCLYPRYLKGNWIKCCKCIECAMNKANEWAYRVYLESQCYKQNCMLTLTYNNENLPKNENLNKRDLQLFIKRLRKYLEPQKITFFACGEYGSTKGRPHYHVIVFGWYPQDSYFFTTDKKGNKLYRSHKLEKLWDKGFSSVGDVTMDSAKYTAIYMQKAPTFEHLKPFLQMSRKCAIGYRAITDKILQSDKIYYHGKWIRTPRIFLEKAERNGFDSSTVRERREKISYKVNSDYELGLYDIQARRERFYKMFPHFKPKNDIDKDSGEIIKNKLAIFEQLEPKYQAFLRNEKILENQENAKILADLKKSLSKGLDNNN